VTSPHDRPVTIHDVAAQAGVSTATISRVVNAQPGVGRATRCRVHRIIDELGYEPNVAARRMRGRAGRAIGVLIPDLDEVAAELLIGVATATGSRPGDLVVMCRTAGRDDAWGQRVVARLAPGLIEGALVLHGAAPRRLQGLSGELDGVAVPVVSVLGGAAGDGSVGRDVVALRDLGARAVEVLRAQVRLGTVGSRERLVVAGLAERGPVVSAS
jgi:DNA-binding LacI/PurR family transcriptional regulator